MPYTLIHRRRGSPVVRSWWCVFFFDVRKTDHQKKEEEEEEEDLHCHLKQQKDRKATFTSDTASAEKSNA